MDYFDFQLVLVKYLFPPLVDSIVVFAIVLQLLNLIDLQLIQVLYLFDEHVLFKLDVLNLFLNLVSKQIIKPMH